MTVQRPNHEDPVMQSARREALVAYLLWILALVYTCGYCYLYGYGRSAESLTLVFGIPDWVVWGIIAPWGVCFVISCWFAAAWMRDEPLAEEARQSVEPAAAGHQAGEP